MEDYKEVTSAIEGRLSLRSSKAAKIEIAPEDYFQSRTDRPPTVNTWLAGRAASDVSQSKSDDARDQAVKTKVTNKALRPTRKRRTTTGLSSSTVPVPPRDCFTTDAVTLTIELAEPNLYLEGFNYRHRTEHQSAVLRGVLHLHVKQKVTLRELSLQFQGHSETIWPESWRLRHLKKHCRESFLEHEWDYLEDERGDSGEAEHHRQSFEPGLYDYALALPMDSSLPETIDLPMGSVKYCLKAVASQTGIPSQNATCSQIVNLIRIPCACSLELIEPCGAHGSNHGLQYSFMLHGRSFPVGGQATLGIKLVPAPECSWERITIAIEEDVRYRTRNGLALREQSRCTAPLMDKRAKQEDLALRAFRRISAAGERMSSTYAGSATIDKPRRSSHGSQDSMESICLQEKAVLQLPSCSRVHPDTAYSCMYVQHTLVITILARITMLDDNHKHFQIRVRLPIQLLTCKLSEGNTVLPVYAESPDFEGLEMPPLCRCVSSSRDSFRLHDVDEETPEASGTHGRLLNIGCEQDPPAYHHA